MSRTAPVSTSAASDQSDLDVDVVASRVDRWGERGCGGCNRALPWPARIAGGIGAVKCRKWGRFAFLLDMGNVPYGRVPAICGWATPAGYSWMMSSQPRPGATEIVSPGAELRNRLEVFDGRRRESSPFARRMPRAFQLIASLTLTFFGRPAGDGHEASAPSWRRRWPARRCGRSRRGISCPNSRSSWHPGCRTRPRPSRPARGRPM